MKNKGLVLDKIDEITTTNLTKGYLRFLDRNQYHRILLSSILYVWLFLRRDSLLFRKTLFFISARYCFGFLYYFLLLSFSNSPFEKQRVLLIKILGNIFIIDVMRGTVSIKKKKECEDEEKKIIRKRDNVFNSTTISSLTSLSPLSPSDLHRYFAVCKNDLCHLLR